MALPTKSISNVMLVKLGNVWVNPNEVVSLESLFENKVAVVTRYSLVDAYGKADEFAAIVNKAIQVQSYGGEPEEK